MSQPASPAALRKRLLSQLHDHAEGLKSDPQSNPVKRLAYDISREVEERSVAFRDIEALVKQFSDDAAVARARRLRERAGLDRVDALRAGVRDAATAHAAEGWEAFRAWAERPALGIVLTAHPTFSLSRDIRRCRRASPRPRRRPPTASRSSRPIPTCPSAPRPCWKSTRTRRPPSPASRTLWTGRTASCWRSHARTSPVSGRR